MNGYTIKLGGQTVWLSKKDVTAILNNVHINPPYGSIDITPSDIIIGNKTHNPKGVVTNMSYQTEYCSTNGYAHKFYNSSTNNQVPADPDYKRFRDGTYMRPPGTNDRCPDSFKSSYIIGLLDRIKELETIVETKNIRESHTQMTLVPKRRIERLERDVKMYRELSDKYQRMYIGTGNKIHQLKSEIQTLNETGIFPRDNKFADNLPDSSRRFATIDM